MVLSRTSICAWTRTWSVTFSVGSRRKRRFAPPMFLIGQFWPGLPGMFLPIAGPRRVGRRRAVERHRERRQPVAHRTLDRRAARDRRVAEAEEEVVHVVVAQAQVAVELEDLHLPLGLLGVAAERLEVGRAVLLGRLFGGAFFLVGTLRGWRLHAAAPGAPKPPGPICAAAGAGQTATRAALVSASRRRPSGRFTPRTPRRARTARRPSRPGAGTRPGGRARRGAASRRSGARRRP